MSPHNLVASYTVQLPFDNFIRGEGTLPNLVHRGLGTFRRFNVCQRGAGHILMRNDDQSLLGALMQT